jgi:hypothetical protein
MGNNCGEKASRGKWLLFGISRRKIMKSGKILILSSLIVIFLAITTCFARDAAKDLKRMIGYTIIDASWVEETIETKYGDKIIKLGNGDFYKVDLLLLDPLPMTDVIIFAKKYEEYVFIKLLIDNEAYDATLVTVD